MVLNNIKQKDHGFTIVELLVVIVVIGILAAITIVSYTGVTAKANTAANKSNAASVVSAASGVNAETGAWPTVPATIASLNVGVTKLPASLTISNTAPTALTPAVIQYQLDAAATGICVGYWDSSATPQAIVWLFSGTAKSATSTTCSDS